MGKLLKKFSRFLPDGPSYSPFPRPNYILFSCRKSSLLREKDNRLHIHDSLTKIIKKETWKGYIQVGDQGWSTWIRYRAVLAEGVQNWPKISKSGELQQTYRKIDDLIIMILVYLSKRVAHAVSVVGRLPGEQDLQKFYISFTSQTDVGKQTSPGCLEFTPRRSCGCGLRGTTRTLTDIFFAMCLNFSFPSRLTIRSDYTHIYSSPMASLVLNDSSHLAADGFEKLSDQIMHPYAKPYDLQKHVFTSCHF
uniref:Uncharacterized protein n=1 Tax=Timema poppense TaxID=170557 RepID=A0A7R9H0K4_TIMPO|nr:unnamed protein product [Timema poppensis]